MSIDLSRNRDALMAAWKDVLDDKSSTDWALFGYEGQTNILKFVSKGSDGLEELIEDLNSGKVMYAFVKVHDPKTSLDKFVLINWQGEGANTLRKGMCANHLRDVEKFFSGAHLTINARNDEEVEPQLIVEKVAKAGSAYSFKTASKTNEDQENTAPTGPVGTAYQRVNPVKEINSKERDQFWRKEEQEEKKRLEEEKLRKQQERLRLEQELQRREQEECAKREAKSALRDDSIDQIKRAEILALEQLKLQNQASEENSYNSGGDVTKSSNATQSDLLRSQRKQEAQELIAQRTIDARSIFEKNTSVGQQLQLQQNNNNNVNSKKIIPEKPARNSIILKAQQQQQQQHNQVPNADLAGFEQTSPQLLLPPPPSNFSDDQPQQHQSSGGEEEDDNVDDQFSTIKRSPRTGAAGAAEPSSPPTAADHSAGAIAVAAAATSTDNRSDTIQDQSTTKTQRYEEKITVAMTIAQQQQQHNTADQSPSSVEHTLITDQQFVDEYLYGFSTPGLQARALYDYQAVDDSEITFDPGDIITNIDQVDEGWWQGLAPNGAYGLFPANYVELIQ